MRLKLLRANIQFLFKTYYKGRKVFKKSKRRLTGINAAISDCKQKREQGGSIPNMKTGTDYITQKALSSSSRQKNPTRLLSCLSTTIRTFLNEYFHFN